MFFKFNTNKTTAKVKSINGYPHWSFEILNKNNYLVDFSQWPTANCQICSIYPFSNILNSVSSYKEFEKLIVEIEEKTSFNVNAILFDIKKENEQLLDKIIPAENFIARTDYISTNGSKMILGIIKVKHDY